MLTFFEGSGRQTPFALNQQSSAFVVPVIADDEIRREVTSQIKLVRIQGRRKTKECGRSHHEIGSGAKKWQNLIALFRQGSSSELLAQQ